MWYAARRLVLGIVLIVIASSILLVSDWRQRRPGAGKMPRVALLQHSSQVILDEGMRGILDALSDQGFNDGVNIAVRRFNAENDVATGNAIAREITGGGFGLVITASTLSMQAVANANRAGKVRHVFGLVADPAGAGVGISREKPLDHPGHMTGIGSFMPVGDCFEMARRLYPGLGVVGVVWNPAESNSRAYTLKAREYTAKMGIKLIEANVDNSSGVFEAAGSLVSRGAQALWIGGDVTVMAAVDSVVNAARKGRIPVFTLTPPNAERGPLFDLGANFYQVGRQTGELAARVLNGADPATIPVIDSVPIRLVINKLALKDLKDPWQLPDDVMARADEIIDETGIHKKSTEGRKSLARRWKIGLIEYNNVGDVEETEQGVLAGLKESGLVDGRDYEKKILNAQGDMSTVNSLVDAAVTDRSDLLITLSTPTLQAAVQRAGRLPVVFTYVANPVAAGAGRSDNDHLPNIAGIYLAQQYEKMIALFRECMPGARVIGTLFVPSEVNTVYHKEQVTLEARKAGLEVVALPVSTSSEISDAALSLASQRIDAIVQVPGNLITASFVTIEQAARKRRLPIFAFSSTQAREGAVVTLSRDYFDNGREAGLLAARIMRGESPASIPFRSVGKTLLIVNLKSAETIGFNVPQEVVKRADQVIGR